MARMPETAVFIATSLDGFIARENHDLDWLIGRGDGEPHGYEEFIATIDAMVIGRKTYEVVLSFEKWYYGDMRVFVLSSGSPRVPDELRDRVQVRSLGPREILEELGESGVKRVYVDGGMTIQRFLREGLIDEMTITRVPVLLGSGIPLFGELPGDIEWEHLETTVVGGDMVQSKYRRRA